MSKLNTIYKVTTKTTPPQTPQEHERMRLASNLIVKWLCLNNEEFKNYNESGCSIDEFYQTLAHRKSQKRKAARASKVFQEDSQAQQISNTAYIS
jgi:hypothetical protein